MFKVASRIYQSIPRTGQKTFEKTDSLLKSIGLPLHDQHRTTVIVKRRKPVKLLKNGIETYKPVKKKNNIFDVVEITDFIKEGEIEVILKQFVEGLGESGDVVKVKRSIAYNTLLVPGLAEYATPEALARVKDKVKTAQELEQRFSSIQVPRTMNVLKNCILGVTMNKDNNWILEPWHIKASFRKAGIHLNEDCIEMPKEKIEGPDLNLEGKEFFVTVTINNKEKVKVRCRIHHWSTELANRLPLTPLHWTMPAEALFNQEKEELAQLPLPPKPITPNMI